MVSGDIHSFRNAGELREWLEVHQDDDEGIWLKLAKKGAMQPSITYREALDVALCFGWIDGQKAGWDEQHFLQRFTPRRARSIWSKINREKAEELVIQGLMSARGHSEIDRAKRDGRWAAAYSGQKTAEVPADLQAALAANPAAKAFFETISGQNRYAILFRIHNVKREQTRARKIETYVDMLARGETIHPKRSSAPGISGTTSRET